MTTESIRSIVLNRLDAIEDLDLDRIGRQSGFVQRQPRKLILPALVKALLSMMGMGACSLSSLVNAMSVVGQPTYSPQALSKRLRSHGDDFLMAVFGELLRVKVTSALPPHTFSSFGHILLQDSTTVPLPDRFSSAFPGSVNASKRSLSQLKIQCIFSLDQLQARHLSLSGFTRNDQSASPDILDVAEPGDLVIRDLGYFVLDVLEQFIAHDIHFLSRLHLNCNLYDPQTSQQLDLVKILKDQDVVDRQVLVGSSRLPVRLVALRAPDQVVNKRRRLARKNHRSKPKQRSLKLMAWSIFITSVPPTICSPQQVFDCYALRWTIEIIFKSWKSHLRLQELNTRSLSMLRLSLLARLLFALLSFDLWANLASTCLSSRRLPSILRLARILSDSAPLITCIILDLSPSQLLHLLFRQVFYPLRKDRLNILQRFFSLFGTLDLHLLHAA